MPCSGDAFELVVAFVGELHAGAHNKLCHGSRRPDFACAGFGCDAGGDVDGDAADVVAADFDLAGVDAAADVEPERTGGIAGRTGTLEGRGGSVEGGAEAVAGRLDLAASEACELAADGRVVTVEQITPAAVAEFARSFRGADDVREEYGREHTICRVTTAHTGNELLDLVQRDAGVVGCPPVVVGAVDLHEARSRQLSREVTPRVDAVVVAEVHDETRDTNRRKDRTDVALDRHSQQRPRRCRARAPTTGFLPPLAEVRVV